VIVETKLDSRTLRMKRFQHADTGSCSCWYFCQSFYGLARPENQYLKLGIRSKLNSLKVGENSMKKNVLLAAALLSMASLSPIAIAQQGMGATAPQTTHVKAHGCVKPGNVSGCYVVNDYKAHRKYNVFFRDTKPDMDTGISFEGIAYGHRDPHCNQGQKVDVAEWKPLAGECPQTEKK